MKQWRSSFAGIIGSISTRQWVVVCRIWASIALLLVVYNIANNFLSYGLKGFGAVYVWRQTVPVVWYCMSWALTFPVSLWVARGLSGLSKVDWRFVAFQVAVCFILVAATGAGRGLVTGAFYYHQYGLLKPADVGNYALSYAYTGFMSYAVSLMLGYSMEYHRLFRDNALRAAKLETQLVQSQLESLKAQLQPHFLFNTLNAIVTLMRKGDNPAAIRMVGGLSDLLRQSLDAMAVQEVTLEQELDMVRKYLDIQQMRFGQRLSVEYRIDPEARTLLLPHLVLQTLAENAIRHGIGRTTAPGKISISASRDGHRLNVRLEDSGPGPDAGWRNSPGIGLKNTMARLEKLYGPEAGFDLRRSSDSGTVATIFVPVRQHQPAA
jgi:hypothetical protein